MPSAAACTAWTASSRSASVGSRRPITWVSMKRSSTRWGSLARFLVLPGEEALVQPLALVLGQEILERGVVALDAALEIELDDRVDRAAVDDRVVAQDRHAQQVDVAVLERARLVVVHLLVAEQQLFGLGDRHRRA